MFELDVGLSEKCRKLATLAWRTQAKDRKPIYGNLLRAWLMVQEEWHNTEREGACFN